MKSGVYKTESYNNLTWLVMSDENVSRLKADFTKKSIDKPQATATSGERNIYVVIACFVVLFIVANFITR